MVDSIAKSLGGDASALVSLLLAALLALLIKTWKDLGERLAKGDKAIARLGGHRQNHDVRIRLIENHIGIETVEYDPDTDNE